MGATAKRAAAVGGAIYVIVEVVLYVIGVIWPDAAPHAQFISAKLTPLIVILSNFLILGDAGLPDVGTRSIDAFDLPAKRPIFAEIISPVVTFFEKVFGFIASLK